MASTASKKNKKSVKVSKPNFWVVLFFLQLIILYFITRWGYHNSKMPWEFDRFLHRSGLWHVYGYKEYGLNEIRQVYGKNPGEVEVYEEFQGFLTKAEKDILVLGSMKENTVNIKDYSSLEICYFKEQASSFSEIDTDESICIPSEYMDLRGFDFVKIKTEGRYLVESDEYKIDLVKLAPINL